MTQPPPPDPTTRPARQQDRSLTVYLADRLDVIVEGLQRMLALEGDFEIVGTARDGETALRDAAKLRPRVLLLDLEMPAPGQIGVVAAIKLASPETRVVVLSADSRPETVKAALAAGADAFIAKDASARRVAATIRAVADGSEQPITWARPVKPRRRDASVELMVRTLSSRELTVLRHLAAGHANARIAKECRLTLNTVRTHVQSILVKLGVHSKVEAVWFAVRHDVVRLQDPPADHHEAG